MSVAYTCNTRLHVTTLLAAATFLACGPGDGHDGRSVGGDDGRASRQDTAPRTDRPSDAGSNTRDAALAVRGSVLVRRDAGGDRPLLALDSAAAPGGVPAVPASWQPAPDVTFRIGASSFRHVVPSPDGRWVAWEAGSTHDLVGVVPADGGRVTVLDFYFDSSAEELAWAPGGRYLLARHLPPSGMEEAPVYDVRAGTRLRTPWDETCRARDGCRVTSAEWTEGTTLAVTTSDGDPRRHEIDVSRLPPATPPAPADSDAVTPPEVDERTGGSRQTPVSVGGPTTGRRPPAASEGRRGGSTRPHPDR